MKVKFFGVEFKVSFPAISFLALAIICDKRGTLLICFFSSVLHEFGHIAAMKLKGVRLKSVAFNLGDVAIDADLSSLSYKDELFVNAGGIAVNFILAIFAFLLNCFWQVDFFHNIIISNILIGVFNFLPVRYLDGGQILLIILKKRFSLNISERILNILSFCFMVPASISGLVFLFNSNYNFSLLFAVVYLICTLVSKEFKNVS